MRVISGNNWMLVSTLFSTLECWIDSDKQYYLGKCLEFVLLFWIMARIRPKDFFRPLGYSECFNQRPFHGKQFVICSVWFMSSDRELTVDWIRECMLKLSKKHPMLRSCIAEHEGRLHWKEMDEPSMICTVDNSSDWQKAFTKYVGTSFDLEKGPLWRCTLMPNVKVNPDGDLKYHFALLVDFHHVIIDGTGKNVIIYKLSVWINHELLLCTKHQYVWTIVELLTIICATLKRDHFLNHFLFLIEIAQKVYLFTQKYKLWPFLIKHGHNLCFGVNT